MRLINESIHTQLHTDNPIRAAVIFGSARSDGNTYQAIQAVQARLGFTLPVVDLAKVDVREFSYAFDQEDDFHPLMSLLLRFDLIIIASPVYWYGVSAKMKCFIDRVTDLLPPDNENGHALRGKKMAVIASYATYPGGTDGFEQPLKNTAHYLGMDFLGAYLHYVGDVEAGHAESMKSLNDFIASITSVSAQDTVRVL